MDVNKHCQLGFDQVPVSRKSIVKIYQYTTEYYSMIKARQTMATLYSKEVLKNTLLKSFQLSR